MNSCPTSSQPPPPDSFEQFARGLHEIFAQWSALRIIRECGEMRYRHDVLDEMEDVTLEWFRTEGEIFPDELANYFEEVLSKRLFHDLEDGSCDEVGQLLHTLYHQCIRGDYIMVEQLRQRAAYLAQTNPSFVLNRRKDGIDGGEDESSENSATDPEIQENDLTVPSSDNASRGKNTQGSRRRGPDKDGWYER